jgi:hypothetical protein
LPSSSSRAEHSQAPHSVAPSNASPPRIFHTHFKSRRIRSTSWPLWAHIHDDDGGEADGLPSHTPSRVTGVAEV